MDMYSDDAVPKEGIIKTAETCTDCAKDFVARYDFDVDGNHVVICPNCGHEHCRVIKKGVMSSDRWDTRQGRVEVPTDQIWKDDSGQTNSAASYIRERWTR